MAKTKRARQQDYIRKRARAIVKAIGLSKFLEAQRNRCSICNELFGVSVTNPISVDHVWAIDDRVQNSGNLLLAHTKCNMKKGNDYPTTAELCLLDFVNAELGFDPQTRLYSAHPSYEYAVHRQRKRVCRTR